jgi:hypothetical protein
MRLHGGADGRSDHFFGDSEPAEYFRLALFSCAAMTAHRRDHKGPGATRFHCINDARKKVNETTHAATAGRDADLRVGP